MRRGWLDRWRPKKNFEHLKIKVESWPDELPDIDLSEIERIYLDKNFYQLLPFQSNLTYTKEVMSKFLQNGTEYQPVSERRATRKSRASNPNSNESNEGQSSNLTASGRTEDTEDTEETASTNRQNVRFEPQSEQEFLNDEGVFSRLRKRLVDSVETSRNHSNSNSSQKANNSSNHKTNSSIDETLETRRNLTKESANRTNSSNQRTKSVDKSLANREVSLIRHRLVKKKVWLNEQAMLSDMNANYLSDLNDLNDLNDFSDCDVEADPEKSNKKKSDSNQSDGPVTSVLRSIRRTSNRIKNVSKSNAARTTTSSSNTRTRRPAKRKAKENLRCDEMVSFAADSHLDFSDLDELDAESNLKESINELHPLKAPTKQLYLFVALVFLSIFTFKFINSQ